MQGAYGGLVCILMYAGGAGGGPSSDAFLLLDGSNFLLLDGTYLLLL